MGEYYDESSGLYLSKKFEEVTKGVDSEIKIRDFLESLSNLELQLEDQGWNRLNNNQDRLDFTQRGREALQQEAYLYWLKNPLIWNAVNTKTNYVYGKGFNYKATNEDVQVVIDSFMDDDDNKRELTTLQAQQTKSDELQIYANLYLVFFVNKVNGLVKVRSIPANEIKDVICAPNDAQKPLWYKRVRNKKTYDFDSETYDTKKETKYYSDWKRPKDSIKPPTNKIAKGQLYHVKVNCLTHNKFGVSELYRAMDWAKAYNKFLEDLASVWAALSKFPMKNKSKGGASAIASQKKKIQSALANISGGGETNPAPPAGGMWFENMASNMEPVNVKGATLDADDGRRLLLMVCAATGMIEPFFGDPATANLATMKAMMAPMLKRFGSRQELWKSIWKNIYNFIIDESIKAPKGLLDGKEKEDAFGNIQYVLEDESDREVEIDFPELDDKENVDMIKAVGKISDKFLLPEEELSRVLMNLLEIDNADEILEEMYPENNGENILNQTHGQEVEPGDGMEEASLMETVKNLKERLEGMELDE